MFGILNSHQDPTSKTVYHSSQSGYSTPVPFVTGTELNSTVLRGYLRGAIASLKQIGNLYGTEPHHQVDLLVIDPASAKVLSEKTSVSKLIHGDDDDLWAEYFRLKASFDVHIVSSIGDSQHLRTVWGFAAHPFEPGELRPMNRAPIRPPAAYVAPRPAPYVPRTYVKTWVD